MFYMRFNTPNFRSHIMCPLFKREYELQHRVQKFIVFTSVPFMEKTNIKL